MGDGDGPCMWDMDNYGVEARVKENIGCCLGDAEGHGVGARGGLGVGPHVGEDVG